MERRKFISTSVGLSVLLSAGCASHKAMSGHKQPATGNSILLKGKKDSAITHWDIITIGNLSRNRYWGESEEKSLHSVICTTTVITGKNFHVIVDPSLKDGKAMADELKRRTGLTPNNIDVVFVTHEHGDHHVGMPNFPNAKWLASPLAAAAINEKESYGKKVEPAGSHIFDVIDVVAAPGHTPGTSGLRFDYKGLSVFVAGDSVATKDFWDEGRMYFKALDIEESLRTYKKIASVADIVVPGHDNYFLCSDTNWYHS
ncbi:MBL fold metallo-hydrolase [Terrimonas alba]|uniref:MBL fold metallo-hydrolase n=1 Tax=Terrimonas alba TaxID=3349636 RepID=UPI0035F356B8